MKGRSDTPKLVRGACRGRLHCKADARGTRRPPSGSKTVDGSCVHVPTLGCVVPAPGVLYLAVQPHNGVPADPYTGCVPPHRRVLGTPLPGHQVGCCRSQPERHPARGGTHNGRRFLSVQMRRGLRALPW
jgi:hypothetical protein